MLHSDCAAILPPFVSGFTPDTLEITMPKWRPIGQTKPEIYSEDGDCYLRAIGECFIPDSVESVIGTNDDHALSLDHIYEQARHGANHHASNLITMHRHCNRMRGCTPFVRFIGRAKARQIARQFPRVAPTIMAMLG